ncbi:hypothetical protein [Anaeromyxobacter oryzae]|uniref:Lipoprotein n=1 Tax=Anaeromyxobacter oryzae TaxID=2918170 RepID=A0ABM7X0G6_9BACT|nr:hypothetical protein [Anaeromyxobacter oryzae]BDG05292.1 hypothetical protein AMOR_42880 [Anaeromyxobacter oryzae]
MRRWPVLAALAAAACSGGSSGRPPPVTDLSGTLAITSDAAQPTAFALAGMTALTVVAHVRGGTPGAHAARVDVLAPSGDLYAQLQGSIDPGASGDATLTRVLEVRGTPIDRYHQTGTWTFVLAVDDGPALAQAAVVITE